MRDDSKTDSIAGDKQARRVLASWLGDAAAPVALRSIRESSSLSGALLWRVTREQDEPVDLCLRAWPPRNKPPYKAGLEAIHALQRLLSEVGPRVTPTPIRNRLGRTIHIADGRMWELTTWRHGAPHLVAQPTLNRLEAACEMLAHVHVAAAQFAWETSAPSQAVAPSPAMKQRRRLASRLIGGELGRLQRSVAERAENESCDILGQGLDLVARLLPAIDQSLANWQDRPLPLQWRLTDVRPAHVLFVDDQVTGIVDFGAAAFDAPAGDLARLLGGMPQSGSDYWRAGTAAYQRRRQMTPDEVAAMRLFDASGVCLAMANWARWLTQRKKDHTQDHASAIRLRLKELADRLEFLANGQSDRIETPV